MYCNLCEEFFLEIPLVLGSYNSCGQFNPGGGSRKKYLKQEQRHVLCIFLCHKKKRLKVL